MPTVDRVVKNKNGEECIKLQDFTAMWGKSHKQTMRDLENSGIRIDRDPGDLRVRILPIEDIADSRFAEVIEDYGLGRMKDKIEDLLATALQNNETDVHKNEIKVDTHQDERMDLVVKSIPALLKQSANIDRLRLDGQRTASKVSRVEENTKKIMRSLRDIKKDLPKPKNRYIRILRAFFVVVAVGATGWGGFTGYNAVTVKYNETVSSLQSELADTRDLLTKQAELIREDQQRRDMEQNWGELLIANQELGLE